MPATSFSDELGEPGVLSGDGPVPLIKIADTDRPASPETLRPLMIFRLTSTAADQPVLLKFVSIFIDYKIWILSIKVEIIIDIIEFVIIVPVKGQIVIYRIPEQFLHYGFTATCIISLAASHGIDFFICIGCQLKADFGFIIAAIGFKMSANFFSLYRHRRGNAILAGIGIGSIISDLFSPPETAIAVLKVDHIQKNHAGHFPGI